MLIRGRVVCNLCQRKKMCVSSLYFFFKSLDTYLGEKHIPVNCVRFELQGILFYL